MADEVTKEELNEIFGVDEKEDWSKDEDEWETSSGQGLNWDFKTQKRIKGVYMSKRVVSTKYGEREIYQIETPTHSLVDIWETAMLKREFMNTMEGTEVRIEYMGKEQTDKGQQVNMFKFQRRKV